MNTRFKILMLGLGVLCTLPVFADTLADALSTGKTQFDMRYRYEFVNQDGFADNANASTLRGRLSFLSGDLNGLRGFVELDAVTALFIDDYNSGSGTSSPRRNRYPVVADPDYAEVNQAYLQYSGWANTQIRVGRQKIGLDNQRFVGPVGFRQNDQSHDAFSIQHQPTKNTKLFYAYIDQVNRIFGHDVPAGEHDNSTHLLNASYDFADVGRLSGYLYSIDNKDAAAFSTRTAGVRFAGKTQYDENPVAYTIEYARQSDAANNPVNYNADYLRLDASIKLGAVTPSVGYESLSGDRTLSGAAFRTPLATAHAFNGWADLFLTTPDAGLVDTWLGVTGKLDSWSWTVRYHNFDSEAGSTSYGDEVDVTASRKFGDNYGLQLIAATFNSDSSADVDVTKLWFVFTATF